MTYGVKGRNLYLVTEPIVSCNPSHNTLPFKKIKKFF